jgi:UDP-N-acetylmuramate dehydrogenase
MLQAEIDESIKNNDTGYLSKPMKLSGGNYTVRGTLRFNEPMARHTSWRAGGVVDEYFAPVDLEDLCYYMSNIEPWRPVLWLGLGSNLLVRDGGFRGVVIAYSGALNNIELIADGMIAVEAGVPCAKVAKHSAKSGFTGAEFLAGIPGSMGGALAMNAGAFGNETWNIVSRVKTLSRDGVIKQRRTNELVIGYRSVQLPEEEWFVSAELKLMPDPDHHADQIIKEYLGRRSATQPMGLPSCGSVFRNPPNNYAAQLIEQCDLKGKRIGDAVISDKHANFIINLGNASADDIETLIKHTQRIVSRTFNINLEPEVRIVGERI